MNTIYVDNTGHSRILLFQILSGPRVKYMFGHIYTIRDDLKYHVFYLMLPRVWSLKKFYQQIAARILFPIRQKDSGLVAYDAPLSKMEYTTVNRTPFGPPINRSMRDLDRDFFHRTIPLKAARLGDPTLIGKFSRLCLKDILQVSGLPHVVALQDKSKAILLAPTITNFDSLSETTRNFITDNSNSISLEDYNLDLDYKYWKSEEILGAILPEDLLNEIPSGFTVVGDIAHMNIRDQYLPYKKLIGTVVHDKNPSIRMVVNKLDTIDTKFRTFDMEVIAGLDDDENFVVEHHESDCRFRFDFRKVYWNSRLHTEHDRLISKFHPGQAVCDVFAGVGPFAVPAGRKRVFVFANDLNPDSYAALVENISLNKVGQFVRPYCEDGSSFIKHSLDYLDEFSRNNPEILLPVPRPSSKKRKTIQQPHDKEKITVPRLFSHYVMNLPDSAITFLPAFIGLLRGKENQDEMPFIHVHCFHKYEGEREPADNEIHEALRKRISNQLQYNVPLDELSFHFVRKVAPTKLMYCVSFKLPRQVAFR